MQPDIVKYQFIKKLNGLDFVEKIILYGSRARGENQSIFKRQK